MSDYYSVDRPMALVVAISMSTGKAFVIPGITMLRTTKDTSGEPGTFEFVCPVRNPYTDAQNTPLLEYMAVAGPMDLVALYATRTSINEATQTPALPFGPLLPPAKLTYGSTAATVTAALGSASCLMVGMVDIARVKISMSGSPDGGLYVRGRDLTKIFYENDTNVPETQRAALADPSDPNNATNPVLLAVEENGTSAQVLLTLLDLTVSKKIDPSVLPAAGLNDANVISYLNSPAVQELGQYGYPWRNFVIVAPPYLNPTFSLLEPGAYPPIAVQQGSAWANVIELRNAPVGRLYVDEVGHLIFDDQLSAWTTQSPAGQINSTEIEDAEFWLDDSELITALAIFPLGAQGGQGQNTLSGVKGIGASVGFVDGLSGQVNAPTAIPKYGNRYVRFDSLWDITKAACEKRRQVVVRDHNSLFHGRLKLRGNALYRTGSRWTINAPPHRKEVQNATWYINSVEHEFTYGEEWTTSMDVRFPQTPDGAFY